MNALAKEAMGELVEADEFFAPTPYTAIDHLFGEYAAKREAIERFMAELSDARMGIMHYFQCGNAREDRAMPDPTVLFQLGGALAALNADFWNRALSLTDVYDCMPTARREEWNKSIRKMTTPEFTEDNVRATLETLLAARSKFLAERVDGIFRGLSGKHVTNSPAAFGTRMIIDYVFSYYSSSYQASKADLINDLRCVIAKFMGRDDPRYNESRRMLEACREDHGVWHSVDGGALRVRCYMKGTAHLEVHEDMAWRLNAILHSLYPAAIPASFRTPPKRKAKVHKPMQRPLPFAVVALLGDLRGHGNTREPGYQTADNKFARKEAVRVLESIGAVFDGGVYRFDYDPHDVLREIVVSGCVPDKVSHQYYPTPERVAQAAVAMLDPHDGGSYLEPSAGQGAIAELLPKDRTTCIEISEVHCAILRAKGFTVKQADFIAWAARHDGCFDRIAMNPPYAEGQYMAHVEAAASLLAPGGQMVAIVPASQRGKDLVPGMRSEWSEVFVNEFAGTSMDVAIWKGVRA